MEGQGHTTDTVSAPELRVLLVQADLYWKAPESNRARLEEQLWQANAAEADLIVLPEMFTTGFTMDAAEVAEVPGGPTSRWLLMLAAQFDAVVTGSIVVKAGLKYVNRLLWATPQGEIRHYDKRHLFRMAGEDASYSPGEERPVFTLRGWRLLPQICYDLRFPVWSRNRVRGECLDYDVALYVANWPQARTSAWDVLLQARAIENLAYTLGVNRVGEDGNQVPYQGHSAAYDFKGEALLFLGERPGLAG
ncbi:nitrilase/cyanide hydratase and apolipoprotein N-acyltransferase [Nitritalea halalkaliphila LW7]|uniref:Omega-amidase YafV n=1 Tax=Nitritalea halalkaliphila LW7 TaxID=1189621 RepID=I5C4A7_9BACT|nr:amidohydrolase [Nitritalea halalkaliphila]EIM76659.1 nitrilase/cyanide hydratase and apolipoprotein N-acyltransferase [Nitritalea halalkaliphila LW7]